jgi:hypothetical protein
LQIIGDGERDERIRGRRRIKKKPGKKSIRKQINKGARSMDLSEQVCSLFGEDTSLYDVSYAKKREKLFPPFFFLFFFLVFSLPQLFALVHLFSS